MRIGLTLVVAALFLVPSPSMAQPKADLAGSFTVLYDSHVDHVYHHGLFPTGWLISGSGTLTPSVSIVGEVGGNSNEQFSSVPFDLVEQAFLVGVRSISRRRPIIEPFGQVLIGAARVSGSAAGFPVSTNFALQPGVGVELPVARRTFVRLQADYRLIHGDGDTAHALRFAAGVGVGLGMR